MRWIFSVNPGRSGSAYLANLLSSAKGVVAKHEPEPNMQGAEMVAWNTGDTYPLERLADTKHRHMLNDAGECSVYAETSNAFIKGMAFVLLGRFIDPSDATVVVLKRCREDVVRSLMGSGYDPRVRHQGGEWLLRPDFTTNATERPVVLSHQSACEWYYDEVYARGEKLFELFPMLSRVDVTLDSLNTRDGVQSLCDQIGITPTVDMWSRVGVPVNAR